MQHCEHYFWHEFLVAKVYSVIYPNASLQIRKWLRRQVFSHSGKKGEIQRVGLIKLKISKRYKL